MTLEFAMTLPQYPSSWRNGDWHQSILDVVKPFEVGEWQVHPSLNRLTRGGGRSPRSSRR